MVAVKGCLLLSRHSEKALKPFRLLRVNNMLLLVAQPQQAKWPARNDGLKSADGLGSERPAM